MLPTAITAWVTPFLLLLSSSLPCRADDRTFLKNNKYNAGEYGKYVVQQFKTSPIEPPRFNFMQPFSNCDDGSYLFIAPRGEIANSSFYIMDHEYEIHLLPRLNRRLLLTGCAEVP